MNTRIQELILEAVDFRLDPDSECYEAQVHPEDLEYLAELIVAECCLVLEQTQDALDLHKWPTPRGCTEYIKDHFGVEE